MIFTPAVLWLMNSFCFGQETYFWNREEVILKMNVHIKIFVFKDYLKYLYMKSHFWVIHIWGWGMKWRKMGEIQTKQSRKCRCLRLGDGYVESSILAALSLHIFENFCISKRWQGFRYIMISNFTFVQYAWNRVSSISFSSLIDKNHFIVPCKRFHVLPERTDVIVYVGS